MKILITTGIYPPDIGGPAKYALNLSREFEKKGHKVKVVAYELEKKIPIGLRHILFLFRVVWHLLRYDAVLALDTISVGVPTVLAARFLGKRVAVRIGGDHLWEGYVERSGELAPLRAFYINPREFSFKEKLIFKAVKWLAKTADYLIFSTVWQRDIWRLPYDIDLSKTAIVENYYGEREVSKQPSEKVFVGSARVLKWKNLKRLKNAFGIAMQKAPQAKLFLDNLPPDEFEEKIKNSYAVVLASLGDVSPNLIMEAIKFGKPFIITKENGITERIRDIAVFVEPSDEYDIAEKIVWLCNNENYRIQSEKIRNFSFTHSWSEIADEFLYFLSGENPKF
ncbi:MAG: glycosyltransferase family 4 protein [bacterium]|nr:glycosyltransferase family 4 protein [bacterium]